MKISLMNSQVGNPKILIAVVDGDHGEVVEQYQKDVGDLDPFELKKLLQNMCDGILSEYRRDLLLGYTRIQNQNLEPVMEIGHLQVPTSGESPDGRIYADRIKI